MRRDLAESITTEVRDLIGDSRPDLRVEVIVGAGADDWGMRVITEHRDGRAADAVRHAIALTRALFGA